MSGEHAKLPPSSASLWGPDGCPGAMRMQRAYPEDEQDQEAAREGEAAHHYLAETLNGRDCPVGSLAPNGHPITEAMREGAEELVDDVRDTLAAASPGSIVRVEHRVAAPKRVHADNWGTPDVYLLDRANRTLHVWDYKFGHRYVEAYRNWQLIDYVACVLDSEGVPLADDFHWKFSLTVAQPRAYGREGPLREWYASAPELAGLISNLSAAAEVASRPDAPTRSGPHCRDCRAQWDCRTNQLAVGNAIDLIHGQQSTGMDAAAIGLEARVLHDALQRAKHRYEALTERALGLIRAGQSVPHCAPEWSKPRMAWKPGVALDAARTAEMFGVDIVKPEPALITPKQAIKAGVDASVISEYAETPAASMRLVHTDGREARRVFGSR